MENQIINITNEWQFWAFLIVFGAPYVAKLFNWLSAKIRPKESEIKTIITKLDEHILFDKSFQNDSIEWRSKQDLHSQGQRILNSLALTKPNCSTAKFEKIKHEFELYSKAGGNGYVSAYYFEWLENRENLLKKSIKKYNTNENK